MEYIEDFLWTRKADLHNSEPRKAYEDDDNVIYGRDAETLYNDILDQYLKYCDAVQNGTKDAYYTLLEDLIETVEHFLKVRHVDLHNPEQRPENDEDSVIYGADYTELYSELFEATNTEMWG